MSSSPTHIGLALSGGGFRATLFHLGVVAAFRKLGQLDRVRVVSCVSGGSITGAHLVLHWDRYIDSDDATFDRVAHELVALTKADVRGQIIRRLPLSRHRRFERCLDQFLYSTALLTVTDSGTRPLLVLNVTDLKHGTAAAFVAGSFVPDLRNQEGEDGKPTAIDVGPFSLARAVSCSAAYPGLFPDRVISAEDFAQPRKRWEAGASLSDGGVYDNLGIQYFLGSNRQDLPEEFFLSDAGTPFDFAAGLSSNVFSRIARVTSVQMNLLRTAFIEDAGDSPLTVQQISISDEPLSRQELKRGDLLAGIPPREIVRRIQWIRTDLDEFSDLEIDLLIRHGFTVAYKALTGSLARTTTVSAVWSPIHLAPTHSPSAIQEQSLQLEKSQRTRLGLFNPKDKAFPVPWFLIVFALLLIVATVRILQPAAFEFVRSPRIDRVLTGQPYRLTKVMRYVVLRPAPEVNGHKGVLAISRIYYWARLNQHITSNDLTFREAFTPTYERGSSVHGLGVIGADAERESEGTLPFEDRQELIFEGPRGETRLLSTGIQYEFDWPGELRTADNTKLGATKFGADEDYWSYDNTSDYIDSLVIVVESQSDKLLVQSPPDCAILYRANLPAEPSKCVEGENGGRIRPGLTLYGGALVAQFKDLKPNDSAILKYKLSWR